MDIENIFISIYIQNMEMIKLLFIGTFIGMANVIPGVSGGTLAVIFGIYDKFVNAITFNVKKLIKNWRFIVPLLLGMLLGVLAFSKLIQFLYNKFPVQTDYAFTGLIFGSIPMLFKYMIKKQPGEEKFSTKKIIGIILCAVIGFAVLIFFNILEQKMGKSSGDISFTLPEITFPLEILIFVGGIIGAITMVIPGISGSLIMLIVGVYPIVIASIPALFNPETFFHALFLLLPNGVGVLIGLVCGAKLVSWLLRKFPNLTYAAIFGLICGSAITLFPGFSKITSVPMAIGCVISLLGGIAMAYFSAKLAPEDDKKEEDKEISTEN